MNFFRQIFGHSIWTVSASLWGILLQAILYLILTRYLDTSELGVFALGAAFVLATLTIVENAFPTSLVRQKQATAEDIKMVSALNLRLAVSLTLLSVALSFIYGIISTDLESAIISMGLAPVVIISARTAVHMAVLQRKMAFRTLSLIDIITHSTFFIITLALAMADYGAWSLVGGFVGRFLVLGLILESGKLRSGPFRWRLTHPCWRDHFDFGRHVGIEKGLSSAFAYADILLVGSFAGMDLLGIYHVLKKIIIRPLLAMYNAIERIVYPMLSNHSAHAKHYIQIYRDFIILVSLIFTTLLSIAAVHRRLIPLILPPVYDNPSLFIALILWCVSVLMINPLDIIMYSKSKARVFLYWFVSTNLAQLGVMLYAINYGIAPMLLAMALLNLVLQCVSYPLLIRKYTPLTYMPYFLNLLVVFPLAGILLLLYYADMRCFVPVADITIAIYMLAWWWGQSKSGRT